jgi:polysaccharide export outer membrane protein
MLRIIFGALLAATVATGAFAQSSYKIRSGDSLQVEVIEDPSLNRTVLVLPDGSINFPLVGTIPAAGRSVNEVRADLASALASNFAAAPNVFVGVGTLAEVVPRATGGGGVATMPVFVMGEVASPGKADVVPGTTILQFLAQAGGFTRFAAQKRIQLRRIGKDGDEKIYLFNYDGSGNSGIRGSTRLQSGDVIIVPQRKLFE